MHTTRGTTQHSYNKASALHRDILLVFKLIPYCDYYLLQVCVKSLEDPSSVVKGPDLLLTTSHCSACSKLEVPALLPNIRPLAISLHADCQEIQEGEAYFTSTK